MSKINNLKLYSTTKRKHLYCFTENIDQILVDAVGKDYLEYRELWKSVSKIEVEPDFPPQLDIELSTTCNYSCPMCPKELRKTGTKIKHMDFNLYKKVIDNGIKNGLKSVNFNYVNEPLFRRDIAKFISYAREKGALDVMFNSNGSLLTEKMSKEIISAGLTKLSISFDATTENTYKKIRHGGNFNNVLRNIQNFLKIRESMGQQLPLLKLTYLMTRENMHELDDYIDYWQDKADLISIQNLTNPFDGERREKLENLFAITGVELNPDEDYKCPQPFQRMVVRHDGTVLACCHFRGAEIIIGNANQSEIADIYQGAAAKKIRQVHKTNNYTDIPACKRCIENSRLANY